jgi:GT2 family glycosyltransferase
MRVIIPCWVINESLINLTENTVNSIRQAKDTEIIIVDNASTMAGGLLRELADTYIRNKTNLGYAKAVNQGLKLCDVAEPVVVSNNDVRVPPQWKDVAEEILENYQVGSVHYRMIAYDQPFNPGNETWVTGKERWCTSSFFVVRNVQLYDEGFLNSYDDWDMWKRMRDSGYTTAYTNKAEYQHMDSFSQQFVPQRGENDARNREYFKTKYGIYPEDEFENRFPGMLSKPWKPQP